MAKIGIIPGQAFDLSQLDPKIARQLAAVPKMAQAKIMGHEKEAGEQINGWIFTLQTGEYGKNYLQRAFVSAIGLGANLPQDAVYPSAKVDDHGQPLSGAHRYIIHFEKDQTPPVKGFWSLTMYDDQYFFVNNPLNRYTLSPRDPLKKNNDGSLDFYIQKESPGKEKESNWLPAPEGKFILMLRTYWPEEAILDGSWSPPPVQRRDS